MGTTHKRHEHAVRRIDAAYRQRVAEIDAACATACDPRAPRRRDPGGVMDDLQTNTSPSTPEEH